MTFDELKEEGNKLIERLKNLGNKMDARGRLLDRLEEQTERIKQLELEYWKVKWEQDAIKKALTEETVIDLDSIYKDGKLFGHQLRFLEGEGIFGNNIVRKYIIYNYGGKEYEVKYHFDFETRLIDFRIQEWCEKICDYVCIAKKIPFQLLCYGRVKIPANEIFDDIVEKMIMEINKKIEEYD